MKSQKIKIPIITQNYCDSYTVFELKIMAKQQNISGFSKMRKAELCEALHLENLKPVTALKAPPKNKIYSPVIIESSKPKIIPNSKTQNKKTPCTKNNLVFPCYVKNGYFEDQRDWDEYQNLRTSRNYSNKYNAINRFDRAKKANEELIEEKSILKNKTRVPRKVRFNI